LFKSGRLALFHVLNALKREKGGGTVLLPAYHCDAMVDACLWSGFEPRFFAVNEDLSPEVSSIKELISSDVKAAVIVHYFGFPTISGESVDVFSDASIPIIEDAAHIDLVGLAWPSFVGQVGRWLIGSTRKFYPVYDGGIAIDLSGSGFEVNSPAHATVRDEIRSLSFVASESRRARQRRTLIASSNGLSENPSEISTSPASGHDNAAEATEYKDSRFEVSGRDAMTKISSILVSGSRQASAGNARRENYQLIWNSVRNSSKASALFDQAIEAPIVPYVFPLKLMEPDLHHAKLRSLGIEILRWEKLRSDRCNTSNAYAEHLVQVPCHEGLTVAQKDYLTTVLDAILND
jgi:hypothetical protein